MTPEDYKLEYKDISFKSQDGIELKGWFIPGSSNKLLIITHPFTFNRHGFIAKNQGIMKITNIDVDFLKVAKVLNEEDYSIIMFDFRNHGISGNSKARKTGIGMYEYQDIIGLMNYIESNPELSKKEIGFVSFCMGANSTIIAMSKSKNTFKDIKCIVAVQPITYEVFVRSFIRSQYSRLSLYLLLPLVKLFIKLQSRYSLAEMSPIDFVQDITAPILYVQAKNDKWTELSDITTFYENSPEPKLFLLLEGKMHRFDTYNYFSKNPKKIVDFLNENWT